MLGIITKKVGMMSVYQDTRLIACTVLEAAPCVITQIKEIATDGYNAVQLAYEEKKVKNTTKPLRGHFQKANTTPRRKLVEFRDFAAHCTRENLALGDTISASDLLQTGEFIDVVGISKGKGFAGVVKRHNFSGVGARTHGQHNRERAPGSIGASSFPSRVFKGMRMAGRHGAARKKVQNLEIIKILAEEGVVVVKGSVPGPANSYIVLQK